jgi:hypothetical protein
VFETHTQVEKPSTSGRTNCLKRGTKVTSAPESFSTAVTAHPLLEPNFPVATLRPPFKLVYTDPGARVIYYSDMKFIIEIQKIVLGMWKSVLVSREY